MLIAQTTAPAFDPNQPAWVNAMIAVLAGVGTVIAALVVLMPHIRGLIKDIRGVAEEARKDAGEAKTTAAVAVAGNEAAQQSVTRLSNRQNVEAGKVIDLAAAMPPAVAAPPKPPKPPDEFGGATVFAPPRSPLPTTGTAATLGTSSAETKWTISEPKQQ